MERVIVEWKEGEGEAAEKGWSIKQERKKKVIIWPAEKSTRALRCNWKARGKAIAGSIYWLCVSLWLLKNDMGKVIFKNMKRINICITTSLHSDGTSAPDKIPLTSTQHSLAVPPDKIPPTSTQHPLAVSHLRTRSH